MLRCKPWGKDSEWIHYLRAILRVFTTLGALVLSTREMFTLLWSESMEEMLPVPPAEPEGPSGSREEQLSGTSFWPGTWGVLYAHHHVYSPESRFPHPHRG